MSKAQNSTPGKPRKKRRLIITSLAGLIVLIAAAAGISAYAHRPDPPVGAELSTVGGVGIVRRNRWYSQKVARIELNDRGFSKVYRDGYELIYPLCDATDQNYPIVRTAPFPAGRYRVSAVTEHGGQEALLKLLCCAYEQAFRVEAAVRDIEIDVFVMTCPDRQALKLQPSARRYPDIRGDFCGGPNGASGPRRTWYNVEFTCDMDNLASYSAYMIRKAFDAQRPAMRDRLLATAIVNETKLAGLYDGKLSWRFYDPDALIEQLTASGLKLTLAKRKVKALVIAPR